MRNKIEQLWTSYFGTTAVVEKAQTATNDAPRCKPYDTRNQELGSQGSNVGFFRSYGTFNTNSSCPTGEQSDESSKLVM